jgi:hypothetical protein
MCDAVNQDSQKNNLVSTTHEMDLAHIESIALRRVALRWARLRSVDFIRNE